MFKQATENKAATQSADTFVGTMTGEIIRRQDLEDPKKLGHLREGLLLDPDAWTAAQRWGLRTPSGRSIGFIEPTPDPREPRRDEAPAELRKRVETARAALEDVRARIQAAVDERAEAEDDWRRAAARGDATAYDQALAREHEAMERRTNLEQEEMLPKKQLADAEAEIRRWIWNERLRRYEKAKV